MGKVLTSCVLRSMKLLIGCAAVLTVVFAGCLSFDNLRGEGFKDSENWGQELREQREAGTPYGGVSTKAQQIERNLGVK